MEVKIKGAPGVSLTPDEADRLKGQIWAYYEGVGQPIKHFNIARFKLNNGTKVTIKVDVAEIDQNAQEMWVNLSL